MKTMLLMLIVGICALAWRTPEVMQVVGLANKAQDPARITTSALRAESTAVQHKPMSPQEFAERSKTDPYAYQKFINSLQVPDQERSSVDKLMNFLARGKYE